MREKDLKEDLATLAYKAEADHEVQLLDQIYIRQQNIQSSYMK